MKTLLTVALLLWLAVPSSAQIRYTSSPIAAPVIAEMQTNSFRLGTSLSLAWDFAAADLTAGNVTRFEARVNSGTWVNTGSMTPQTGTIEYRWAIPNALLPLGTHTVSVRACNSTECGTAASVSLTMTPMMPATPSGPRIVPSTTPVTVDLAVEMANAYSTLFQLRRLNDSEIWLLSSRYGYPLTKGYVLQFMDEQSALLSQ